MPTKVTPAEALLWLAGLEKEIPCPNMAIKHTNSSGGPDHWCLACGGTSVIKVPVLEGLRDTCPNFNAVATFTLGRGWSLEACQEHEENCHAGRDACKGGGWVPNPTRQAIQDAMNKLGADFSLWQYSRANQRIAVFTYRGYEGKDADDHISAMKALKEAGYG